MEQVFLTRLQQLIARTRRHPGRLSSLLLFTEPKGLAGEIEDKLRSLIRCEDTLVVLKEGTLFAVLLEELTHISDPLRVAERYRSAVRDHVGEVAIVTIRDEEISAEQVYHQALDLLKKIEGDGTIIYFNEVLGQESLDRLQLEAELEQAVGSGKLVTYYQPIFNLEKGILTGFEALVRWEHPEKGLLLPADFLSIAKMRGHLLKIDEFVLQQSLRQISLWNKNSDRPLYVSVNLATGHFLDADNFNNLLKALNTSPKVLKHLRIDICEQVLFDQAGLESLKTLDNLKIGFNLDDFGVDAASFHCLRSFPFNALKIDRNLIARMEDEVNAELIVALLRIARRMGMKTIAEGVVTHAQLEELRNLGCREAQGFLFSEAVDAATAGDLINDEYRW